MTTRHNKLLNTLAIVALLLFLPEPAHAQPLQLPGPQSPVLLFGFEGTNGTAGWRGLKCSLTNAPVSEGTQALTFVIPQYREGDNKWPSAIIDYNDGRGYNRKDWSQHAMLALDAWTDSPEPERLSIELRDGKVRNNIGHNRLLQPGIKNEIKVSLTEIERLDTSGVQQLIFFASLPPRSFRVTIDNVRLVPGEPPPVAEFDLVYPNYRNLIFPHAKSLRVSAKLNLDGYGVSPQDCALRLDATAQRSVGSETVFSGLCATGSIPAAKLALGPVRLTATVVKKSTGQPLASETWTLRKINPAEVSALKVYIDADNNTIVDGKPFFPLGWFSSPSEQYLDEVADSPFNCVLDYGMDHVPKEKMLRYLDAARQKGIKVIYCLNDVYPGATYLQSWEGIKGNQPIADAVVQAYKDHPAVLAWYLNDELPREKEPQLRDYYQRIAGADPSHPCYIVLCEMPEVKYFSKTTDIMGVDPYPVPDSPVTMVAKHTDVATGAVRDHKPAWIVPQAFAWYQYRSTGKDRGHTPSEQELKEGRAPTFEEGRCMTYLALTHGAKGLIYYCYYDFRVLPQYKEIWSWMKAIASEVKTLSPMLLSPDDLGPAQCAPSLAGIHTRLKKHQGKSYLMATNGETNGCHVIFDLGRKTSATAQVLFENRSIKIEGKQLADDFKPLEAHVYQW